MGIRWKLLLPLILLMVTVTAVQHLYWLPDYLEHEAEDLREMHKNQLALLAAAIEASFADGGNSAHLHATLDHALEHVGEWKGIVLTSSRGERLYPLDERESVASEGLTAITQGVHSPGGGAQVAELTLHVDLQSELAEEAERIHQLEALALGLLLLMIVLSAILQDRWVNRPLYHLTEAAKRLAKGDFYMPLPISGNDEVGQLAGIFDHMRQTVAERQSQLEQNERQLRAVLNNAVDAIITMDEFGVVQDFNPAAENIFGYRAEEVIGRNIIMLMPEKYAIAHDDYIQRYLMTGQKSVIGSEREVEGQHKDGTVFPMTLTVSELMLGSSRLFTGFLRDITMRKRDEQAMMYQYQLLSAINNAQSRFINSGNPRELFNGLLSDFLMLSDSAFGFIGLLQHAPDGTAYLKSYTFSREAGSQQYGDNEYFELRDFDSVPGKVITTGDKVIDNSPHVSGMSPGHPSLHAFMGLPIKYRDELLGMVGVANRPDGYDESMLSFLSPLVTTYGSVIWAWTNAASLRTSEARLSAALEGANEGLWDWNIATGELYLSSRWETMLGYEPGDIAPQMQSWEKLLHPDDRDRTLKALTDHLEGRTPSYETEHRLSNKSGEWIWILSRGKVIERDAEGKALRAVGTQTDITARIQQQRRESEVRQMAEVRAAVTQVLHQSGRSLKLRLQDALTRLQALPVLGVQKKGGIFLRRDDSDCLDMFVMVGEFSNEFIEREQTVPLGRCLCGRAAVSGEILVSDDCFCDPRHENRFQGMTNHGHYIVPLMHHGKPFGVMFLYTEPNPSKAPDVLDYLNQIGEILGLTIVEERTRAAGEEARKKAEALARAKSEFLATMSHEIRTPMNGVLGMTQVLSNTKLSSDQRQYLDIITESGKALLALINDILDFSKIEAGMLALDPISFDLERAAHEVSQLLVGSARAKGLELILRYAPDCPRLVIGDAGRIRQILVNLVGNAIKFTERGHVLIDISGEIQNTDQVHFRIDVIDTGIGIEPGALGRLFQSFSQADSSTTRRFGGTGLGLAICKRLAEAMGGTIDVESVPGAGTTFRVELALPLSASDDETEPLPQAALEGVRVLVVEDHPVNRQVLQEQLQQLKMRVKGADHAQSALTILREAAEAGEPFELAVLDYLMPDQDGEQLAQAIRAEPALAGLSLVMLTSAPHSGDLGRFKAVGFDGYLTKPVRSDLLTQALSMVLGVAKSGSEGPLITVHHLIDSRRHPEEARARPSFTGRVLLVEDVEFNQLVAKTMLGQLGLSVDLATNGEEALVSWSQSEYDLILMDCQMPVMDGFQATRAIREQEVERHRDRLPIIALTANAMSDDREKCEAAGMDDFLAKPIEEHVLIELLRRWLSPETVGRKPSSESPVSQHPTSEAVIDTSKLDVMRDSMGEEAFTLLVPTFLASMKNMLEGLVAAAETGDQGEIQRFAHSMKSASAQVGAMGLSEQARVLEEQAKNGTIDDLQSRIDALQTSFDQVEHALMESAG